MEEFNTKEKAIEATKQKKIKQSEKKIENERKIEERKKLIKSVSIRTNKYGWLTELSKKTGINRQTLMDFIKKYMPEML